MGFIDPSEIVDAGAASGGGRFIDPTEVIDAPDNHPSWGDAAQQVAKDLGEGVFQVPAAIGGLTVDAGRFLHRKLDQLNQAGGLPSEIKPEDQDPFKATRQFTTAAKGAFDTLAGNPADTVEGPVEDVSKAVLQSAVMPGNPVTNAVSGLGSEVAAKTFPNSDIAPFVGAMAGPTVAGGVERLANAATKTGRAFERASVGAGQRDYLKSQKIQGMLEDEETGGRITRLNQATNEIGNTDGWPINRSPESLDAHVQGKLSDLGSQIGDMISGADSAGVTPSVSFSNATAVIDQAKASKPVLRNALNDFMTQFSDPVDGWNGTVSDLHAWSQDVRNLGFAGEATGQLPAQLARKLKRAIGSDLQSSVKDSITQSGIAPEQFDPVFRQYSNYATIAPVVSHNLLGEEASTPAKVARGLLRTSGGVLTTPTVIGSAIGGTLGGPVGLLAGGALGTLASPTGSGIAGSALKLGGRAGKAVTRAIPAAGAATAALPIAAENIPATEAAPAPAVAPAKRQALPVRPVAYQPQQGPWSILAPRNQNDLYNILQPESQSMQAADPKLIQAMIHTESNGNPNAVSPVGAQGLMQIMPATFKQVAQQLHLSEADPMNPEHNVAVGSAYISQLLDKYNGDLPLALSAYNWGMGNVDKALANYGPSFDAIAPHLPTETKNYVAKIVGRYQSQGTARV